MGERYVTLGGVWPSVMKRYEGVGGCQMCGKKALRNVRDGPKRYRRRTIDVMRLLTVVICPTRIDIINSSVPFLAMLSCRRHKHQHDKYEY